jgi:hypothetical protein
MDSTKSMVPVPTAQPLGTQIWVYVYNVCSTNISDHPEFSTAREVNVRFSLCL